MTDLQTAPEAGLSKESLFPEGWDKPQTQPEAVAPETPEEPFEADAADETLAEAQDVQEQESEATPEPEAVFERMQVNEFAKAAGLSLEEFYRNIYRLEDGREVSISEAFDDRKTLREANDALLRERAELQDKVSQVKMNAPVQDVSPEAYSLAEEAKRKIALISEFDWSTVDPGQAANAKLDLQMQAQTLWSQAEAKQLEHNQSQQKLWQERIEEADRQARSRIPEWNDAKVRQVDWQGVRDMAAAYGISAQEIDSVHDARFRHLFRDALHARAAKERLTKGVKTINKVGRTAKAALPAGSRGQPEHKPSLADARKALAEARKRGASLEELNALRLKVPLG